MDPIHTMSEVFDAIQKAKAGASGFCTNFFPVQRKLQDWLNHGELIGELRDGVALFLRKDRGFWHLYFSAPNAKAVQRTLEAWPGLKTEPVVVDLVGQETALGELIGLFDAVGFHRYRRLFRMASPAQADPPPAGSGDARVGYADRTDAGAVLDLLCRTFDRYAEQLPMLYEVEAAVKARQIWVARCEGALAGLLFFETQGLTSTLRYWLVAEPFRAHRFGSALMHRYFTDQSAAQRFIMWVVADNEDAIRKYHHYGFAPDGLMCHVLANELIVP